MGTQDRHPCAKYIKNSWYHEVLYTRKHMTGTTISTVNNTSPLRVLLVLALLMTTYFLLQGVSGTVRTPIKQTLSNFPSALGEWKVLSNRASTDAVIKMLGVNDYVEYNYANSAGQTLNFYAAFYESVGTGGGYHSPKNCIPGGGWGIDRVKTVQLAFTDGRPPVTISEMIIRNRNEYQVVMYWYQNRGRIIGSEYWEKIYLVLDAVFMKRRDGTFVRLIAPVTNGDIEQTEKLLQDFSPLVMKELERFLPGR